MCPILSLSNVLRLIALMQGKCLNAVEPNTVLVDMLLHKVW